MVNCAQGLDSIKARAYWWPKTPSAGATSFVRVTVVTEAHTEINHLDGFECRIEVVLRFTEHDVPCLDVWIDYRSPIIRIVNLLILLFWSVSIDRHASLHE